MHHRYMHRGYMHHDPCVIDTYITRIKDREEDKEVNIAWVTWPERPKNMKYEVKQARRAQSRPEGPPPRSWGPEGP